MKILLITLIASLIMTGCGTKIDETVCTDINDATTCKIAGTEIIDIEGLHNTAIEVLNALKNDDTTKLKLLMSKDGIRFSPYSYVNLNGDVVITESDIEDIEKENKTYTRGSQDGSGDPITMNFKEYRGRYIYDAKFINEGIRYLNTKVQRGNTTNNIYDIYTGNMILEYYIPGKSNLYKNMDRKSLTIILGREEDKRKVKGIIHGERTI